MDRKLQDHVWKYCLPKEFKEEVKRMYRIADSDVDQMIATIMLENVFGLYNLTSDEEEEDELLFVSRKKVRNLLNAYTEELKNEPKGSVNRFSLCARIAQIKELFGSACLPDEDVREDNFTKPEPQPEPKFRIGDEVRCLLDGKYYRIEGRTGKYYYILSGCGNGVHEDYLIIHKNAESASHAAENVKKSRETESKTENRESDHIADADKMFDGIVNQGFREHNRLHIAAMAMQAIISRGKGYDAQETADMALEYADALMHEAEKGGKR